MFYFGRQQFYIMLLTNSCDNINISYCCRGVHLVEEILNFTKVKLVRRSTIRVLINLFYTFACNKYVCTHNSITYINLVYILKQVFTIITYFLENWSMETIYYHTQYQCCVKILKYKELLELAKNKNQLDIRNKSQINNCSNYHISHHTKNNYLNNIYKPNLNN